MSDVKNTAADEKKVQNLDAANDANEASEASEQMPEEIRTITPVKPRRRPKAKPLSDEELEKGLENLRPYMIEAIKDRIHEIPRPLLEALVAGAPISRKAMIAYKIPFNQHQKRELAVEAVYQHLLLDRDIKQCLYNVLCQSNQADDFLYQLTVGTADNEVRLQKEIAEKLRKDWSWERLSKLEQAILLVEANELETMDLPRNVIINEAVTLAKEYCDTTAPALINGILDKLG